MSGTGTATGMSLTGTVAGNSANMLLSGTQASLKASTDMGLDINTATADTTTLSGGTSAGTASTVALADNRAEIMTADSGWGRNGMMANATTTTLIGGGTSMALSGSGAHFSNASGGPVTVSGVADGRGRYDAVNYHQLQGVEKLASRGIAAVSAMSNIPQVEPGKTFALGAGVGSYNGYQAIAIGASGRITENTVVKASLGTSENGHVAFGGGVSYSW